MAESPLPASAGQIRVLCVDDHALFREGLAFIINAQPDMTVVAAVGTAEDALTLYRKLRPDVTVMDLRLPRMSGLEALAALRAYDATAKVVMLTASHGDEDIHAALRAGAASYVLKEAVSSELIQVLRDVHAGERPLSGMVAATVATHGSRPLLSPREQEILRLLAQGLRNKEIAKLLGISDMTAQAHLKRIFAKLGVSDRTAAVTAGLRRGIIHLNSES